MVRLWGLAIRLIVCSRSFLVVKVDLGLKMAEDRRVLQIIRIDGIMDHMALLHVAQVTVKSVTVRAIVTMITVCQMVGLIWLHLKNEVSARYVSILRVKDTAVALKSASDLVPASLIELVEIVSPSQVESIVLIPVVDLNIVEEKVPWHINRVEIGTPCVESGSPEVHPQGLLLVHEIDSVVVVSIKSTDNIAINSE